MGRNNKKPKIGFSPRSGKQVRMNNELAPKEGKQVRTARDFIYSENELICWHLRVVDREGPWGFDLVDDDIFWNRIFPKIQCFETMKWSELPSTGSHPIAKTSIIPEARRRLEEIHQDDTDELYSLRMNGRQRLWGIRDRFIFKVLWWDPSHEICPSELKNT
jgi:hypothetical protein